MASRGRAPHRSFGARDANDLAFTCDGHEVNGCKTDTAGDPLNCGGSGKVCGGVANGTPACAASVCGIACDAGYSDCRGARIDDKTGVTNCGECGKAYAAGEVRAKVRRVRGSRRLRRRRTRASMLR
jgi:hypothetical protein